MRINKKEYQIETSPWPKSTLQTTKYEIETKVYASQKHTLSYKELLDAVAPTGPARRSIYTGGL